MILYFLKQKKKPADKKFYHQIQVFYEILITYWR